MLVNRVIKSQINQILNELHLPEIKSYLEPIQVIKMIEHKKQSILLIKKIIKFKKLIKNNNFPVK